MPVSSPSYFPPQRTADRIVGLNAGTGQTGNRVFLAGLSAGQYTQSINDLYVIGDLALSGGTAASPITDTNFSGTIAVGSSALAVATSLTAGGGNAGPCIVIGRNAVALAAKFSSSIVIGDSALSSFVNAGNASVGKNVLIGNNLGTNVTAVIATNWNRLVVVGHGALNPSLASTIDAVDCVIIGQNACGTVANSGGLAIAESVIIGSGAGAVFNSGQAEVYVGHGAGGSVSASGVLNNVLIGHSVAGAATVKNNVVVGGGQAIANNAIENVIVGANLGAPPNPAGQGNIFIGASAGSGDANNSGNFGIWLEHVGAARHTALVGNMSTGNLVLGNSTPGTNRDTAGAGATNIVKLIAGTKGASNPIGGGYFYITGANNDLHFVNSAGADSTLSTGSASGNGGSPTPANTQTFTGSGTWTKPTIGNWVRVIAIGGGGGGGSGASIVSGTASSGGAGGGGGAYVDTTFPLSAFAGNVTVTVAAGGTAGAAASNAAGNPGGVGGTTTFGTFLQAFGGGAGQGGASAANSGGGAGGGYSAAGAAGAGGTGGTGGPGAGSGGSGAAGGTDPDAFDGGAGGAGCASAGAGLAGGVSQGAGSGGGSGAGLAAAPVSQNGGAGGNQPSQNLTAPAGGAGAGGPGTAPNAWVAGTGAAGGASSAAASGFAGGTGAIGGGGGGGGSSISTQTSGAGGAGGPGFCVVITY